MAKRKIEEDYYKLANKKGFEWVGGRLPRNTHTKTRWRCKKEGHMFEATYNNFVKPHGCPVCSGHVKKIEEDYYKLANKKGFEWVGIELPKTTQYKTLWQCEEGHKWEARYNDIYSGNGCPRCSGLIKKTENGYHRLALLRKFKWIGKLLPKNTGISTWWKCLKCGGRWEAAYSSIQQGSGCPCCAGNAKKTEEDYHMLAKNRGFVWVGCELPKRVINKTQWECKKGHKWETTYNSISCGNGCSVCKDLVNGVPVSKPQIKLNNLLCGSLNYPEGKYRIDVAIMRNSQRIAVEYDCCYWHKGNEAYDTKRDNSLIFRGWKILHIKSRRLLPTRKQLTNAIGYLLKTDEKVCNVYLEDWRE